MFCGILNSAVEVFVFVKYDPHIIKKVHNVFLIVCSVKQICLTESKNVILTFLSKFREEIGNGGKI